MDTVALLPVQIMIPGAMEFAIMLLIFLLFAAPIALVLLGGAYLLRRRGESNEIDKRITDLEAQVESLRETVENGQDR